MPKTCFVHIGTHKTGTKSIQHALAASDAWLGQHDIFYPYTGRDQQLADDDHCAHHRIAFDMVHYGDAVFESAGIVTELLHELSYSSQSHALLSSESFSNVYRRPKLLKTFVSRLLDIGYEAKILCYLRPQSDFAASLFATLATSNEYALPFDEYISHIILNGSVTLDHIFFFAFDYCELLAPFEASFGRHNMTIRAYRKKTEPSFFLRELLATILGGDSFDSFPQVEIKNETKGVFEIAREIARDDRLRIVEEAIAFTSTTASSDDAAFRGPKFEPLSPKSALRMHNRFSESNAKLFSRFGVYLPTTELVSPGRSTQILSDEFRRRRLGRDLLGIALPP